MTSKQLVNVFKALGDETRIKIVELLIDGEKCGCRLIESLDIPQPTLSHHTKILCDSGVLDSRKDGKWTYYKISSEVVNEIKTYIDTLV